MIKFIIQHFAYIVNNLAVNNQILFFNLHLISLNQITNKQTLPTAKQAAPNITKILLINVHDSVNYLREFPFRRQVSVHKTEILTVADNSAVIPPAARNAV